MLIPLALDQAYSYGVPPDLDARAGRCRRRCRSARAKSPASCGRCGPGRGGNLKSVSAQARDAAARPGAAEAGRLGRLVHAGAEGLGAGGWPCDGRRTTGRSGRKARRSARRAAAGADDAGAGARHRRRRGRARCRKRALAEAAAVSVGVIDGLVDDGTLERSSRCRAMRWPRCPIPDHAATGLLGGDQAAAAAALVGASRSRAFGVTLLDGVTGSGKTEVYFEAVADGARGRAGRR